MVGETDVTDGVDVIDVKRRLSATPLLALLVVPPDESD